MATRDPFRKLQAQRDDYARRHRGELPKAPELSEVHHDYMRSRQLTASAQDKQGSVVSHTDFDAFDEEHRSHNAQLRIQRMKNRAPASTSHKTAPFIPPSCREMMKTASLTAFGMYDAEAEYATQLELTSRPVVRNGRVRTITSSISEGGKVMSDSDIFLHHDTMDATTKRRLRQRHAKPRVIPRRHDILSADELYRQQQEEARKRDLDTLKVRH